MNPSLEARRAKSPSYGGWAKYDYGLYEWLKKAMKLIPLDKTSRSGMRDRRANDSATDAVLALPLFIDRESRSDKGFAIARLTQKQLAQCMGVKKPETAGAALAALEEAGLLERVVRGRRGNPSAYVLVGYIAPNNHGKRNEANAYG